ALAAGAATSTPPAAVAATANRWAILATGVMTRDCWTSRSSGIDRSTEVATGWSADGEAGHRMQLDVVRCAAGLTVREVEEGHAPNGDATVRVLERAGHVERGVHMPAGAADTGRERTDRSDAARVGDLRDHRAPVAVAQDQVVVAVGLADVLDQPGAEPIGAQLVRRGAARLRSARRLRATGQITDGRVVRMGVDLATKTVRPGLDRPAFGPAVADCERSGSVTGGVVAEEDGERVSTGAGGRSRCGPDGGRRRRNSHDGETRNRTRRQPTLHPRSFHALVLTPKGHPRGRNGASQTNRQSNCGLPAF